jgi:uncharacterized coiled-coil protein SlyX
MDETSKLQSKIARQQKALDALNRKVTSQRFYLRVLNELGRDITKEEFLEAKAALENESKAERLDYALVG